MSEKIKAYATVGYSQSENCFDEFGLKPRFYLTTVLHLNVEAIYRSFETDSYAFPKV